MGISSIDQAVAFLQANRSTFLATVLGQEPWVRAMWLAQIDDDGTIWYATGADSNKVMQIRQNAHVSVAAGEGQHGVRLFGTAEIVTDSAIIAALWQESWTGYFTGKDDPNLLLLKIRPTRVEVW